MDGDAYRGDAQGHGLWRCSQRYCNLHDDTWRQRSNRSHTNNLARDIPRKRFRQSIAHSGFREFQWRRKQPLVCRRIAPQHPHAPLYTALVPVGDALGVADVPAGISGTAFAVLTAQPDVNDLGDLAGAMLAGPFMAILAG